MEKKTNISQDYVEAKRLKLGQTIKVTRETQGLTTKDLSDQIGVKENTVKKIEAGKFSTEIDHYIRIGVVLNLKLQML